jgi:hypothetical protein
MNDCLGKFLVAAGASLGDDCPRIGAGKPPNGSARHPLEGARLPGEKTPLSKEFLRMAQFGLDPQPHKSYIF